jgi:hypothetical protein
MLGPDGPDMFMRAYEIITRCLGKKVWKKVCGE